MMTTFKQFITENPYHPSNIGDSVFIAWCEHNAAKYLARARISPIYRGMKAPNCGWIDTDKMDRTSANTKNYYTIWMDNNPEWKDYPQRSKSLICSSSYSTADGFGSVQLIIPADMNKIGICLEHDLWRTFTRLFSTLKIAGLTMDSFMDHTHTLISRAASPQARKAQQSYDALVDSLKSVTLEVLQKAHDAYDSGEDVPSHWNARSAATTFKEYLKVFKEKDYATLYDLWKDNMDPEENDFDVTIAGNMRTTRGKDRELWVQGKCATISLDYAQGLSKDSKLAIFLNKYFDMDRL
jgi:hypothetical protein